MTITNTQLAAALIALGFQPMPMELDATEVVFCFGEDVADYHRHWQALSAFPAHIVIGNKPIEIMFRVSKARQWVLKQVVHGKHNYGLTLPADTLAVSDLDTTVALIASGCYLLKLDKPNRLFHFSAGARIEKDRYDLPSEWYDHARSYLRTLNDLVRKIHNRNLARQPKQHAITCV